ncbi:MAG: hypothetical protein FWE95_03785 [Planctomycetaceae bacterium]|nr:hypothetical protein [Planctomycetaceae bacterium]
MTAQRETVIALRSIPACVITSVAAELISLAVLADYFLHRVSRFCA